MNFSTLRVFLPILAGIILASSGCASAQIVVLGHSAAHGYVAENEMWSSALESILRARGSQVHVINAGINGETTEAELARVDSAVPNGTKIVILTVNGFNDAHKLASGTANSAANVAAIKRKISARGHQDRRRDGNLHIGAEAAGHGVAGPSSSEHRRQQEDGSDRCGHGEVANQLAGYGGR